MYTHKLGLALAKGMTKYTEAEVGFNTTSSRFDAVILGLGEGVVHTKTLDVSYSILNQKENTAYRVTIRDEGTIQKIVEEVAANPKPENIVSIYKRLVNDKSHVLIKKRRDKRRSKELDDGQNGHNGPNGLTLKMSEEVPVTEDELAMLNGFTKGKAKAISFRVKDRHTKVVHDANGFKMQVDATRVTMGDTVSHEVEIELTSATDVSKVPKSVIDALDFNIQRIKDIIVPQREKSSARSSARSSSRSSSSSHRDREGKQEQEQDGDIVVRPKSWSLPNRQGFLDWTYKTYKYKDDATRTGTAAIASQVALFPHQKFVRDFMHISSPYRGIVLFHGLGSGKTLSSIAAAEGFVKNRKKVIVMIPASLETNYREEIIKSATFGNPTQKMWTVLGFNKKANNSENYDLLFEHLHLHPDYVRKEVAASGTLWIPATLVAALPVGTGTYSVEKENVKWANMDEEDHKNAKDTINHLLDMKYKFVRYNGISKDQFDKLGKDFFNDAFIVIDEAHNFVSRVVNGGNASIPRRIYSAIMDASESKVVLLTGSPVINHPFELSVLLNLARGPMKVHQLTLTSAGAGAGAAAVAPTVTLTQDMVEGMIGDNYMFVDQLTLQTVSAQQVISFTLLPHGYVNTVNGQGQSMVTTKRWKHTAEATTDAIVKSMKDALKKAGFSSKLTHDEMYAFPSKKDDFVQNFIDTTDKENPHVVNMDMFSRRALGLVSYFRSSGANFPEVYPRRIEKVPLCDTQFVKYVQARDKERAMEKKKGKRGLLDSESSVYRAYSRMACNFAFPKDIDRVFPSDIRMVMKREVQIVDEDEEKQAATEEAKDGDEAARPVVKEQDVQRKYEASVNDALKALETDADKYLAVDQLDKNYSAKFARIYEHLEACPGKALLYSQFRVVEGLGILQLMLEHQGYVEVKLEQRQGKWTIVNADMVLNPAFNGRRFIIFDGNREKTQIMLQIFNGAYALLPESIQEQLSDAEPSDGEERNFKNLRGDLIKLLMITQSGAEGISLRNVRRVFITEPFWNMVRMDQVIGRAVRMGSHDELPPEERNVEVFIYTSTFTEKQLDNNFTLRRQDSSMTSDTHIIQKAVKKDALIQEFLNNLKSVSVDCRNNSTENRMTANGLSCYAFPIPVDPNVYAYTASYAYDKTKLAENKLVRRRKVQGRVVARMEHGEKKKYVVLDDKPGKMYDYDAYKHAGVLVEAQV